MSLLTKAQILGANDLAAIEVPVPEWGGSVRIVAMTAAQREALETEFVQAREDGMVAPPNWRAKHLALCVVDAEGKALFTEAEAVKLTAKSAKAVARVFDAINALNQVGPDAIEAAAGN